MGDNFDGCECFWSHEMAMRRLLSLLRQNQNYCTDTECIDLPSTNPSSDNMSMDFTTMTMLFVFAVILFMLRPNSLRRNQNSIEKPTPSDRRDPSNGAPPPSVG